MPDHYKKPASTTKKMKKKVMKKNPHKRNGY